MPVIIEGRNPDDLITTYNQIEIQRSTTNAVAGMATIATVSIDTTYASDLSSGYTAYTDENGEVGTHYYRFRFKASVSGAVSAWSDIFLAGGSVLQARFRRIMRDTNSANYFFTNDDLEFYEEQSIQNLWPTTWFETYSDTMIVPDGTTEIFTFSVGVTRVNKIDFLNTDGENLGRLLNWEVRGRQVLFDQPPRSGITVRVWVDKMFLKLAEVPPAWDTHLLNLMKLQAYETMEADRSRYYKYNSVAKPEGGNLSSLGSIITRLEAQIDKRANRLKRVRRAAFIKLV